MRQDHLVLKDPLVLRVSQDLLGTRDHLVPMGLQDQMEKMVPTERQVRRDHRVLQDPQDLKVFKGPRVPQDNQAAKVLLVLLDQMVHVEPPVLWVLRVSLVVKAHPVLQGLKALMVPLEIRALLVRQVPMGLLDQTAAQDRLEDQDLLVLADHGERRVIKVLRDSQDHRVLQDP